MVTIDALDKFVRNDDGYVRTLHIAFDNYAVGRLSVCADTWTRILCHVEDRPNVRVFSVTLSDNLLAILWRSHDNGCFLAVIFDNRAFVVRFINHRPNASKIVNLAWAITVMI